MAMNELVKELDAALKERRLLDGDGSIDEDVLRLMKLRTNIELAQQIEWLVKGMRELKDMIRNKM